LDTNVSEDRAGSIFKVKQPRKPRILSSPPWKSQISHQQTCNVLGQVDLLFMTAIRKVCGLTLLLRVGTLWRCGDGLFFEVPPLASDALLTTLHPLLENVLQTIDHFEISCLGAPFHGWKSPEIAWGEIWTVWRMV
jgi:hypothetical protein